MCVSICYLNIYRLNVHRVFSFFLYFLLIQKPFHYPKNPFKSLERDFLALKRSFLLSNKLAKEKSCLLLDLVSLLLFMVVLLDKCRLESL